MHSALLKLFSGQSLAQLIAIVGLLVLSSIYNPTQFGYYSAFLALVGIFSIISCLTYEQAIPLQKTIYNKYSLFLICLFVNMIVSFLLLPLLYLAAEILDIFTSIRTQKNVSYLTIFISVFFVGVIMAVNFWSLANKKYETVRNIKICQAIIQVFLQISLFSFVDNGLIVGYFVALIFVGIFSLLTVKIPFLKLHFIAKKTILNLKKYKRFPLFSTWEVLLNALSTHFLPIYFVIYFTADFAGQYALAVRMVGLPMILLGGIFSQYIFSKPEIIINSYKSQSELERILEILLFVSFTSFCVIYLMSQSVFSVFLGLKWQVAGEISNIMALAVAGQIIGSPLSAVFPILQKQTIGLALQIMLFLVRFLPLILLVGIVDKIYLIYVLSLCTFLSYIIFAIIALRYTSVSFGSIVQKFVSTFKWQICLFTAVVVAKVFSGEALNNPLISAFLTLIFFVTYILTSARYLKRIYMNQEEEVTI